MSRSPPQSSLRRAKTGRSPPPHISTAASPPRILPPEQSNSNSDRSVKAIGPPLHSLLREPENPIPPPLNSSNATLRDGAVVVTNLRAVLEDVETPVFRRETSPERPVVTNRMSAPAAPTGAKVGRGPGNGMRVEFGVVELMGLRRAEVVFRVLEVFLCLISFSVMAAGKTSGWAGDSFDRYTEFRYCISMNIIAFVYAGFQLYAELHHRIKKMHIIDRPLSYYLDFFMDQVLAYLLISASSSAAARNDDWISMFGSDDFTNKINGSIATSFLAFFAFACSSIISAYKFFCWSP